jgi:hypothetical protein
MSNSPGIALRDFLPRIHFPPHERSHTALPVLLGVVVELGLPLLGRLGQARNDVDTLVRLLQELVVLQLALLRIDPLDLRGVLQSRDGRLVQAGEDLDMLEPSSLLKFQPLARG